MQHRSIAGSRPTPCMLAHHGNLAMDFEFDNHTALVTGASQGIGRAIAKGLAGQGVRVAMAARRTDILEKVAAEIRAAGGAEPVILEADLYPDGASEALAQKALAALGRVDILINSAGGSRPLS